MESWSCSTLHVNPTFLVRFNLLAMSINLFHNFKGADIANP